MYCRFVDTVGIVAAVAAAVPVAKVAGGILSLKTAQNCIIYSFCCEESLQRLCTERKSALIHTNPKSNGVSKEESGV